MAIPAPPGTEQAPPENQQAPPENQQALPGNPPAPVAPQASVASLEYEFDEYQNNTFRKLASAMQFVGIALMVVGGLYIVLTALAIMAGNILGVLGCGIGAALYLAMGSFLTAGAKHIRLIVATEGNDITHLMFAMDQLFRLFNLQRVLIIVSLVLLAIVILVFIAGFAAM